MPDGRSGAEGDDLFALEVLPGDGLALRPSVAWPDGEDEGLGIERVDPDGLVGVDREPWRQIASDVDESELEPSAAEEIQEGSRMGLAERNPHAGIAPVKIGEDPRQAPFGERLERRAEPHRPSPAAAERRHLFGGALRLEQQAASPKGEALTGLRQTARSGAAFEERHAELALEAPYLLREGRLRDAEAFRGGGEAHRVGDGQEVAEVAELHIRNLSIR